MIPLLDLKDLNAEVQEALEAAVLRVARSGRYSLGPECEAFEQEWADYCGTRFCVGVGNCLEAMQLVLLAWGVGPGDEVIVPSNTYIATWLAVTHAGARPVPVEPDSATFNLDPTKIAAAITPQTKAIIAVHLYGRPAEMLPIMQLAQQHGLRVLEDAAQAHGAKYRTRLAGALGDAAAFSFYPSKNLGGLGDGGAVTTDDEQLAAKVRRMRNYGGVGRIDHTVIGINSRLDELQAAALRVKISQLDRWNRDRARRAHAYSRSLDMTPLILPDEDHGGCWHQYVVRVLGGRRDALIASLSDYSVEAHIHYPVPPHLEGAYASLGYARGAFPIAEQLADEVLSLPIGNDFGSADVPGRVHMACREAAL